MCGVVTESLWFLFIAGVIDPDYQGTLKVVLYNSSADEFNIEKGDRIAQLILERYAHAKVVELEELADAPETERGDKGFGSTGKK